MGFLLTPLVHAEESDWAGTLERISSGVVSIRIDSTRAFDTEWNASTQATGFVVDAERGIILTNRHVVTPGPVVAEAIFLNNEEVQFILWTPAAKSAAEIRHNYAQLPAIRTKIPSRREP